jgi:excisionase family DNA binding protein
MEEIAFPDHEYLTVKELADLLRLKERKIYDLASSGAVPCSKATGKLLFPAAEIRAWIEQAKSGGVAGRSIPRRPRPRSFWAAMIRFWTGRSGNRAVGWRPFTTVTRRARPVRAGRGDRRWIAYP